MLGASLFSYAPGHQKLRTGPAYAEDDYAYGEAASCPPAPPPAGARPMLGAGFSCGLLRALLGRGSYGLEYRPPSGRAATASGFPLRLRHGSMYINQMSCAAADGAVRAYMVFYADQPAAFPSNDTARWVVSAASWSGTRRSSPTGSGTRLGAGSA